MGWIAHFLGWVLFCGMTRVLGALARMLTAVWYVGSSGSCTEGVVLLCLALGHGVVSSFSALVGGHFLENIGGRVA